MTKKIAIVGAGIAGLHCALYLKDYAEIEIFEEAKRTKAARPLQMEGSINQFKFTPDLKPSFPLSHNTLISPHYKTELHGKLGYLYKIGGKEGIDAEIRRKIEKEIKIHYSHKITSLEELQDFDVIIAADGWKSSIALLAGMRERYPYKQGIGIGSTVKGDFTIGKITTILNNYYAPNGYTYLIPFDEEKATLAAAIGRHTNAGDNKDAGKSDVKNYVLNIFRERLRNLSKEYGLTILNEWMDYEMWYHFRSYQKDNIYIVGGAASFTDEALGYGLKYAIWSAKLCAQSIIQGKDYNLLLKPLLKELYFWRKFSPYFCYTEKQQDIIVRLQGIPPVKNMIEKGLSIKSLIYFLPIIKLLFK